MIAPDSKGDSGTVTQREPTGIRGRSIISLSGRVLTVGDIRAAVGRLPDDAEVRIGGEVVASSSGGYYCGDFPVVRAEALPHTLFISVEHECEGAEFYG